MLLTFTLGGCHSADEGRQTTPATTSNATASNALELPGSAGEEFSELDLYLRAPTPDLALAGPPTPSPLAAPGDGWGWLGRSVSRDVPIYNRTHGRRFEIGGLRLGSLVRLRPDRPRGNCRGGWFQVEPRGYACLTHGLRVSRSEVPEPTSVLTAPNPNAQLPFRYVHVTDRSAWLYGRVPSADEREAVLAGDKDTIEALQARSMDGAFFLAVEGDPQAHPDGWLQTLHGNYIRAEVARDVPPSKLQGSLLGQHLQLPVAFVVEDGAPVYAQQGEKLVPVGSAERYARVPVEPIDEDSELVRIRGTDHVLKRAHVRTARRRESPSDLDEPDSRWLHVDLSSQTLVAYEGDEPRFATLIASGLSPRDTPTGEYHVRYKYRTSTMRGEDENGPFEVQEVPWTMFYYKSYAVHAAYWHDAFGAPRSHGCTNLAPLDARWVFHFTSPDLPPSWERVADKGTRVVFTERDSDA